MRVDDQPKHLRSDDEGDTEMSDEESISGVTEFPDERSTPVMKKRVRMNPKKYIYSVFD
jgi:hypothetical protein